MKRILFTTISLVLLSSSVKSHDKMKVVQLGCLTPMFAYANANPFAAIASSIGKNKEAKIFRVSWSDTLASGWDRGTMLYDRTRGILKYYDVGGAGEAGEEYYRKSYMFTGLKDATFVALVGRYNNQKQIGNLFPFSFLDTLPKYGCHKFKLDDYKRGF